MKTRLQQRLHAYAARRSPWGPPWWIYVVAFGAVNLIRQLAIALTPAQVPPSIGIASWAASALVVIAVVNAAAVALQRRDGANRREHPQELAPMWPLLRTHNQPDADPVGPGRGRPPGIVDPRHLKTGSRWAPWWVYLAVILGANYLWRAVLADGGNPAVHAVVTLAVSVVLFVVVTAVHRTATRSHDGGHRAGGRSRATGAGTDAL